MYVEDEYTELKIELTKDIKKEIIAFANTKGGKIYIGIDDDGNIIGLKNSKEDLESLSGMIREGIKSDLTLYTSVNLININDKDIINAIKYHTTGKEDMDIIEKIIYIADLIEEDRDFPGVEELRDLVYNKELDKALLISFNNTIKFVIENNQLIHNRTVDARNYLIKNKIL